MDIRDLKIGNIVSFVIPNSPVEVYAIVNDLVCTANIGYSDEPNADRSIEDFLPIELSDKWLSIMGLQNNSGMYSIAGQNWYVTSGTYILIIDGSRNIYEIRYVHQLQNIISDLFGVYLSPVLETLQQNIKVCK